MRERETGWAEGGRRSESERERESKDSNRVYTSRKSRHIWDCYNDEMQWKASGYIFRSESRSSDEMDRSALFGRQDDRNGAFGRRFIRARTEPASIEPKLFRVSVKVQQMGGFTRVGNPLGQLSVIRLQGRPYDNLFC